MLWTVILYTFFALVQGQGIVGFNFPDMETCKESHAEAVKVVDADTIQLALDCQEITVVFKKKADETEEVTMEGMKGDRHAQN